ncbi:hypothetical protein ACFE04_026478 [Oxalis oulophora]
MAEEEIPILKSTASPNVKASQSSNDAGGGGGGGSQQKKPPPPQQPQSPQDFILSVASNISSQPLQNFDSNVWAVLTAISNHARKRHQGINMLLVAEEHVIGRLVNNSSFRIEAAAISGNHCKIFRKRSGADEGDVSVFLKDSSTNGTFLNFEKCKKTDPEVRIQHGDIVSFAAPPHNDAAFAFVYREVARSTFLKEGSVAKRKPGEFAFDSKRLKGIGIGAPEGPLSLDDFKSLQRSNKELRKQLESQDLVIDTLRNENRENVEHHEKELKETKESIAKIYVDSLKDLENQLIAKKEELTEVNRILAEQKDAIEDLTERLNASKQSCTEANEIVKSQKADIGELKTQIDEERDQRRTEREKAAADLKAAIQKAQCEAQEELKRVSDSGSRRERELQEEINKLTEREKGWCEQVDCLRPKLEDTRQKLVSSENKVRQLETQVHEGQLASVIAKKRIEALEHDVTTIGKELEQEKAAREEAWAKVSALELEISAAMRDLDSERRRLKGARERIMLRETQLRAFYSTTEEISSLFTKQQEQLKAMQRTLEDEENYDNASTDMDLNTTPGDIDGKGKNETTEFHHNNNSKTGSATSPKKCARVLIITSSDEASATEKHDCDIRSQQDQNTQEAEYTSGGDHLVKCGAFGSDIDGIGTAPVEEVGGIETEKVLETESPRLDGERNVDLNKCSLAEDTMQLDDETQVEKTLHNSQPNNLDTEKACEDTEIRTQDLLTSEVPGSWAYSTNPSVHGDNGSQRSRDNNDEDRVPSRESIGQAAESQTEPSSAVKWNNERKALSEMIGIVAPDLKEQFGSANNNNNDSGSDSSTSISDTEEECPDTEDNNNGKHSKIASISDAETDDGNEDQMDDDDDDEATQADSLG